MKLYQVGSHIEAYPHEETKLNIYNRNTRKTFVLGEKESKVFKCLNGANSLEDICKECPFYSKEEIVKLVEAFEQIGLFETRKNKFNPFKIKVRLFNPNRFMKEDSVITKLFHYLSVIGGPLSLLVGILLFRGNISNPETFLAGVMEEFSSVGIADIILFAVTALVSLALHEFAHMVTARRYGVNVPEIGVMLYFLIPCAYTNISGINLLESKGKRLTVLLSGSLTNLGIIGACLAISALVPSPVVAMFTSVAILFNLGAIFMNTMVLLKFDGYYILETILDEPKFREKAISHMLGFVKLTFSKNKEAKRAFNGSINDSSAFLLHAAYCFYAVLSLAYIPFVMLNTVVPFII